MNKKPLVGISTCLLGEKVRYDGGHKQDRYLRDILGQFVDFYAVCPEVECGMEVPREAMRLVDTGSGVRLLTQRTEEDKTLQMEKWMCGKLKKLSGLPLCGFIFKAKSPSSGLMRVKVYKGKGVTKNGIGIFARGFTEAFPLLPVEEDGRLNDSRLRENFIERIFIMHRWHMLIEDKKSRGRLMDFHAAHKYALMSHCPKTLKELGHFIAENEAMPIGALYLMYFERFIGALKKTATVRKNTNVLQHIMGYFKKYLSSDEKSELSEVIGNYHVGMVPLVVPITLLNHYVRKYDSTYLKRQVYLNPHPLELMLRNHV